MKKTAVIGASAEEFFKIEEYLPEWELLKVSLNDGKNAISAPLPESTKLVILYACKAVEDTMSFCGQVRDCQTNLPILLIVVGRYEIIQGSAVRDLGNTTFITTPFCAEEFVAKLIGLFKTL